MDKLLLAKTLLATFQDDKRIENSLFSLDLYYKTESTTIIFENDLPVAIATYEVYDPSKGLQIIEKPKNVDIDYYNYLTIPMHVLNKTIKYKCVFLSLLAVHPDYQGKGLSKKLLNSVKLYAKNNNLSDIILWTDLRCSHSFYEHINAKKVLTFNSAGFYGDQDGDNTIIYSISSK